MTRADAVRQIVALEQFAAQAKAVAARHRETLTAEARAEYAEKGTAPTWRIPNLGKVILPISQAKIFVSDEAALAEWISFRNPEEIETVTTVRPRPAYVAALIAALIATEDDVVIDPETGELVPGLSVTAGGLPKALSITVDAPAKRVLAAAAEKLLGSAQAAIAGPVIDGETAIEGISETATFTASGDPFALFPPAETGEQ